MMIGCVVDFFVFSLFLFGLPLPGNQPPTHPPNQLNQQPSQPTNLTNQPDQTNQSTKPTKPINQPIQTTNPNSTIN